MLLSFQILLLLLWLLEISSKVSDNSDMFPLSLILLLLLCLSLLSVLFLFPILLLTDIIAIVWLLSSILLLLLLFIPAVTVIIVVVVVKDSFTNPHKRETMNGKGRSKLNIYNHMVPTLFTGISTSTLSSTTVHWYYCCYYCCSRYCCSTDIVNGLGWCSHWCYYCCYLWIIVSAPAFIIDVVVPAIVVLVKYPSIHVITKIHHEQEKKESYYKRLLSYCDNVTHNDVL